MKENYDLIYRRLTDINDVDIEKLCDMSRTPEISRFISMDEQTLSYVTSSPSVYYYMVYKDNELIGAIHLESEDKTLFMSIEVHPMYHRQGYGKTILEDVLMQRLQPDFEQIKVSIDETNIASRRLFEKMGFVEASKEDELIDYFYNGRG